jgi:hypothetical protein
MANQNAAFLNNPSVFMQTVPLLVGIPPDHVGQQVMHFNIDDDFTIANSAQGGGQPCQLTIDAGNTSQIQGYWCRYQEDRAFSLPLGAGAPFMFTAGMSGCSFLVRGSGTQAPVVCHSNYASVGHLVGQHLGGTFDVGNRVKASLVQKALQKHAGERLLGGHNVVTRHSFSNYVTTIVGIQDPGTQNWSFARQVSLINDLATVITLQSCDFF